jgi:pyruvate ferredoxin oxidoreductase gamma subunit
MIEVIWHGRGGQGAFTAARLLGAAFCLNEGAYALAFPSFGPERRGAPMRAYTKLAHAPIGDRSASTHADLVVYLDQTLLDASFAEELKPGGKVLVNSDTPSSDPRVMTLDADGISSEILGRAIPNTALLAALSTMLEGLDRDKVVAAITSSMPARLHEKNIAVVDAVIDKLGGSAEKAAHRGDASGAARACSSVCNGTSESVAEQQESSGAPDRRIPTLRDGAPAPCAYDGSTCFEGGYLVNTNAGWRQRRPVIDPQACVGCLRCYMHCPDGVIYRTQVNEGPAVAVDLDFCKGCGVCELVCPFDAISMVAEGGR